MSTNFSYENREVSIYSCGEGKFRISINDGKSTEIFTWPTESGIFSLEFSETEVTNILILPKSVTLEEAIEKAKKSIEASIKLKKLGF